MQARPPPPRLVRAHARQLGIGRAPQALAGGQQRHGFEQVGLARAVGAGEHDGRGADAQRQAGVVAEVGELQPLDPDALDARGSGSALGIDRRRRLRGDRRTLAIDASHAHRHQHVERALVARRP